MIKTLNHDLRVSTTKDERSRQEFAAGLRSHVLGNMAEHMRDRYFDRYAEDTQAENGTDVQVLGWNPEEKTGVFTGDFENELNGRNVTQSFVDEGADVILPVAGPVGKGSAALAQELGDVWVIGVDADWFQTLPEFSDVILTSVLKGLDVAVSTAIQDVAEGNFQGETRLYTIAEDGVGLGPIADSADAELVAEVEAIREGLKDGSIVSCGLGTGPSDSCPG